MLMRKKKLQWVAHCARRGEGDLTWRRMRKELEDEQSTWGEHEGRVEEARRAIGADVVCQGRRSLLVGK